MLNTNPFLTCKCDNCGKILPYKDAVPAVNPEKRVDFGKPYSDIECPKCGALMYPANEDTDTSKSDDTSYLVIALEAVDKPLTDDEKDALVSVAQHGSVEDALQVKASVRVTGADIIHNLDFS